MRRRWPAMASSVVSMASWVSLQSSLRVGSSEAMRVLWERPACILSRRVWMLALSSSRRLRMARTRRCSAMTAIWTVFRLSSASGTCSTVDMASRLVSRILSISSAMRSLVTNASCMQSSSVDNRISASYDEEAKTRPSGFSLGGASSSWPDRACTGRSVKLV